jgi:hypothetical protein
MDFVGAIVQPAAVHIDAEVVLQLKRDRHGDRAAGIRAGDEVPACAAGNAEPERMVCDRDEVGLGLERAAGAPGAVAARTLQLPAEIDRNAELDDAGG